MKKFAIILAGGEGRRAGGNMPKQFVELCGRPLVWWSMKAFKEADPQTELILVVHPGFFDDWELMRRELSEADNIEHMVVCGGRNRPHSVLNGLIAVEELIAEFREHSADSHSDVMVAIHDGARPLIDPQLIDRGFRAAELLAEDGVYECGVVPAVRAVNSLRKVNDSEKPIAEVESHTVNRADFVEVQTPQIFGFNAIRKAFAIAESKDASLSGFTDDASIAEAAGMMVRLYEGSTRNIKVTHPDDFAVAGALLR